MIFCLQKDKFKPLKHLRFSIWEYRNSCEKDTINTHGMMQSNPPFWILPASYRYDTALPYGKWNFDMESNIWHLLAKVKGSVKS